MSLNLFSNIAAHILFCLVALVLFIVGEYSQFSIFFICYCLILVIKPPETAFPNVVYLLGVIFCYILYFHYMQKFGVDFPYYIGGSDDLEYENNARIFASNFSLSQYSEIRGGIVPSYHNSPGYIYILALFIRFGDWVSEYHTQIPRIINVFFLTILSIVSYKFASKRLLLSWRQSNIVAYAVGLSPLMVYVSSHIFRDTLVSLLMFSSIYLSFSKINILRLLAIVCFILLASQLRIFSAFLILFFVILIKTLCIKDRVLLRTIFFFIIVISSVFMVQFGVLDRLVESSNHYTQYRIGLSSGFAEKIFSIPFPVSLPVRALYYVVTPVPVLSMDAPKILLSIGVFIQLLMFPILCMALFLGVRNRHTEIPMFITVVVFLCLWLGLSITTFSIRHMSMFYPFAILIVFYGLEKYSFISRNKNIILSLSFTFGGFIMILYPLLKVI